MQRLAGIESDSLTVSPLEAFVREYVEARDGVWDQIEPQVYDLMVGSDISAWRSIRSAAGTPRGAARQPRFPAHRQPSGRCAATLAAARFYLAGANLHPRDLESRVSRP